MSSATDDVEGYTVIKPFTEQKPFLQRDKRYMGYISGVGAGKTYAGIVRTVLNMTEWNRNEMGAIIAPTRQMIVNVIIPEMRNLGLFDAPINWEYKSAYSDEPGIHTPEGSRALILSADNKQTIERLRGLNLAWVYMDERTAIPKRAQDIAMQRLRIGEYRNLYITTTPKGKDDVYEFFVGSVDATETTHGKATLYETDDRRAIVGVPTDANPHTPEDYKEAMESDLPEQIRAQEVQGQFVEIGSGIFQTDMLEFVTPDELPERDFQYLMGVDVGVESDSMKAERNDTDYWAATLLAVNQFANDVYVVDCHRERGLSLNQGVKWIKSITPGELSGGIYVESNQSQRWLKQSLKDAGLNAKAIMNQTNKEERLIQMSIPLERGTVKFINREVDSKLGYDPRWRNLIQELLAFPESNHDDLIDSLHIAIDNAQIGATGTFMGANPYGE